MTFTSERLFVAQTFSLLYRRLSTGKAAPAQRVPTPPSRQQNEILRYSRLKVCVTRRLRSAPDPLSLSAKLS